MHGAMAARVAAFAPAASAGVALEARLSLCRRNDLSNTTRREGRTRVTMLRVRKSRRPQDWETRQTSLSGRFLPLDPKDEDLLDVLEGGSLLENGDEEAGFGAEGPPASAYAGASEPGRPRTWNKRAEAARRRWADPEFRGKMLAKRAEKKMRDEEEGRKRGGIEIGCMDSITLCDDDKAKQINDYVRSNRLKSEKITAYHRDRRTWMETRLSQGEDLRWRMNRVEYKKQRQDKRQEEARRRHARMKAAKEKERGEGEGDAAAKGKQ